jgi:FemAB-related protein (PEP-CTERM system-associated)
MMQVLTLTDEQEPRWDAFVENCQEATFFHRAGWRRVLEQAFRHRAHFLYAEQDGQILGVLPLARVRSLLFGHHLVSTPFCVYGGPAALDQAALDALIQGACSLARKLQVDDLELRNPRSVRPDWPAKDLYVTFRKAIDADPEVNMKAIPRKQRAMVRKGIQAGLQGEPDAGVGRLYRVYSESVRNLGTPVFARRYLEILRRVFGDACEVLMIQHQGEDVAGVMSFYFRDQVLPYYGGSRARARSLKANDFMYWDLMCRAAQRGMRLFDYGRSKVGSGSYSFKKNWGFHPEPLSYEYFLVRADQVPQVNPNNPKYRYFIDLWKRLPLPLANRVGPFLAKDLG